MRSEAASLIRGKRNYFYLIEDILTHKPVCREVYYAQKEAKKPLRYCKGDRRAVFKGVARVVVDRFSVNIRFFV